jgi:16S rRNA (guanine1516-N2)-methyltransferase
MPLLFQKCDQADISWLNEFLHINKLEVFPQVSAVPVDYLGHVLTWDAQGLSLYCAADSKAAPTRVDFLSGTMHRRLSTSNKRSGLLKAAGLDKYPLPLHVLDATAGLGIDAYSLAARGCRITLLEKSPVMAALLADGLRRGLASGNEVAIANLERMSLHAVDARHWMQKLAASERPDVITLDPMFPPRQKTAKVKKDMALMQTLLPPNEDIEELLALALQRARKRVVLKRPGRASREAEPKPDFQVPGTACHFQVFITG